MSLSANTDAPKALVGRNRVEILDLLHATSKPWEAVNPRTSGWFVAEVGKLLK